MSTSSSPEPHLFATDPAWADVTPIEQYEGSTAPLAPILYGAVYKDATDYLRAIVASNEKSPRVLELTEAVVRLNPSHYTAWQYRYETLLALKGSTPRLIAKEEDLMDELAIRCLKSYQVWHHRRLLVLLSVERKDGKLAEAEVERVKRELEFISRSFEEDSKNYHTWSYRQWVLSHFFGSSASSSVADNDEDEDTIESVWTKELAWTERMLEKDVRNNSAWHHRFFVVFERPGARVGEGEIRRELRYTKQSIALAPNNASAWNYLRGVLHRLSIPYASLQAFVTPYTVVSGDKPGSKDAAGGEEDEIIDPENPRPSPGAQLPCPAALEFLADVYEKEGEREGVLKAVEIWKSLANEHDTMRRRYWEHRIREGIEAISERKSA
ncbi:protein prenylyltransferase [Coprinellus micaceus]|uniref:Protein farnesyltransferase/geranylgeranyltransferase type-1 subunit alpha n=1 Tax=Coprinellus micaceus TaxID=71717 RepID=A0A4Y7TIP3_COPMI|nr:protein prenylyltransferase [Coprinellus micaceus]